MFSSLPKEYPQYQNWTWDDFKPYADKLISHNLTPETLTAWLTDWSDLSRMLSEMFSRLYVAITVDTTDQESKARYNAYLDGIYGPAQAAGQACKQKLLASGLEPEGMRVPLMHMRAEVEVYREANLPLLAEEYKLSSEYDKIIGAQTVTYAGKEYTVKQLEPLYLLPDRAAREQVWRLGAERQLADRDALNDLWMRLMTVRGQIAANAGLPDYRAYMWKTLHRYDYTPQDCYSFHAAIEQEVVLVMRRIHERRRQSLGLETLRPWDKEVDPLGRDPLKPYQTIPELEEKASAIFYKVDPQLGGYFDLMRRMGLLDLENRKGKAPGAYCTGFDCTRVPFMFENAVGLHDDVQTVLHESGHAFHCFESYHLPYHQQLTVGMEIAEVASMAMELLAAPYLTADQGGYYSTKDAARARIEHLESQLLFWPYMAVVDAFQHWVYENHAAASRPENCDAKWSELWDRFMVGVDYTGLEDNVRTGWQRKMHIFQVPFYYIEYGLAQLGAMQIWRNAIQDQAGAVAAYRRALSLGGTAPLPDLYAAAGVRFAFDAATVGELVRLAVGVIEELEQAA
jgi:oligoendopeptidase F